MKKAILDPLDFVRRLWVAMDGLPGIGPTQKLMVIAHGGIETGWGRIGAAATVHNYWNLSAGTAEKPSRDWTGPVKLGPDKEFAADGKVKDITQRWRVFGSDREAVQHFLSPQWINVNNRWNSEYANAARALYAGDAVGYIRGLRAGRYFTLPLEDFVDERGKKQTGYQRQYLAVLATAKKFAKQAGLA